MHVLRGGSVAKIWIDPVEVEYNRGYGSSELNAIVKLTQANQNTLLEAWYEHFDD